MTTFMWQEKEPMASYLATDRDRQVRRSPPTRKNGIRFYDAIDPALFDAGRGADDRART